jgi:hypothetical protein
VPKRWFIYFYLCGLCVNTVLFAMSIVSQAPLVLVALLYQCHLFRRLYECVNVHRFSSQATMHVFHFLFGMVYYLLVPLSLYSMGQTAATTPPAMPTTTTTTTTTTLLHVAGHCLGVGATSWVGGQVAESLVELGGGGGGGGSGGGRFAIAEKCTNMGGTVGHDADEQQGTGQSIPQDGEIKDEGVVVQHWAQHLRKEEVVGRGGW